MKKLFLAATLSILIVTAGFNTPASADATADATSYVDRIAGKAMEIMKSGASKSSQIKQIEAIIKDNVDIKWIGQFVMGQHWRTATPEQQKAYIKHYEDFILKSYASRFTEYQGDGYKMLNSRADSNDKYTVKMAIDMDGKQTYVDYKLREKGGKFQIFDIKVEGVSLINTQRSEFNTIIQNNGVDYLIDQLKNKSDELVKTTAKR